MGKLKILLVDDEADFVELMSARIKSWGYDIESALSGKETLDLLAHKIPDVIILDYLMPVMDGVACLREIRAIAGNIPVIMLTAHPEMKVIKAAQDLGVNAFIAKLSPYSDVQSALKTAIALVEKNSNQKEPGKEPQHG